MSFQTAECWSNRDRQVKNRLSSANSLKRRLKTLRQVTDPHFGLKMWTKGQTLELKMNKVFLYGQKKIISKYFKIKY